MKYLAILLFWVLAISNLTAQCPSLTCSNEVFLSLEDDGTGFLIPDIFLEDDLADCNTELSLLDAFGDEVFPFSDSLFLDCAHLGTFTYEIMDTLSGSICWGTVIIEDKLDVCPEPSAVSELDGGNVIIEEGRMYLEEMPSGMESVQLYDMAGHLLYSNESLDANRVLELPELPQVQHFILVMRTQSDFKTVRFMRH